MASAHARYTSSLFNLKTHFRGRGEKFKVYLSPFHTIRSPRGPERYVFVMKHIQCGRHVFVMKHIQCFPLPESLLTGADLERVSNRGQILPPDKRDSNGNTDGSQLREPVHGKVGKQNPGEGSRQQMPVFLPSFHWRCFWHMALRRGLPTQVLRACEQLPPGHPIHVCIWKVCLVPWRVHLDRRPAHLHGPVH